MNATREARVSGPRKTRVPGPSPDPEYEEEYAMTPRLMLLPLAFALVATVTFACTSTRPAMNSPAPPRRSSAPSGARLPRSRSPRPTLPSANGMASGTGCTTTPAPRPTWTPAAGTGTPPPTNGASCWYRSGLPTSIRRTAYCGTSHRRRSATSRNCRATPRTGFPWWRATSNWFGRAMHWPASGASTSAR